MIKKVTRDSVQMEFMGKIVVIGGEAMTGNDPNKANYWLFKKDIKWEVPFDKEIIGDSLRDEILKIAVVEMKKRKLSVEVIP